jgi:hypothetical protein
MAATGWPTDTRDFNFGDTHVTAINNTIPCVVREDQPSDSRGIFPGPATGLDMELAEHIDSERRSSSAP